MDVPHRPPLVIRAPVRDVKNNPVGGKEPTRGVSPELQKFMDGRESNPRLDITVFTNSGVCPHGPVLLECLKGFSFKHVDVSQRKPPAELSGTPSIIYKKSVYCGDAAFELVEYLVHEVNQSASKEPEVVEAPANPFAKKATDDYSGCGLSQAFAQPKTIEVDESQLESTDEAMSRMLACREVA